MHTLAYKQDLKPSNERDIRCADHPDRRALALDASAGGDPIPRCEECYMARWPTIRQHITEQRLVQGGLR